MCVECLKNRFKIIVVWLTWAKVHLVRASDFNPSLKSGVMKTLLAWALAPNYEFSRTTIVVNTNVDDFFYHSSTKKNAPPIPKGPNQFSTHDC